MSTSVERFTTNCPSCDAGVAVKAALVGKKIECPKCKFRFVVPGPGGDPVDGGKPDKSSKAKGEAKAEDKADPKGKGKGKKKEKEKKGGGNGKVIVGAIVGVVALIGLAVGAILIFGKLSQNDSAKATTQTPRQNTGGEAANVIPGGGGDGGTPGAASPGSGVIIDGDPVVGEPGTQPGGSGDPMNPGAGGTTPPPAKPNRPARTGTVDITNLLPGDTTAIFHARLDELDRNARTLRNMVFDKATTDLFKRSMNFTPDQVVELVQAEVGMARDPFVVFRTKGDLDEALLAKPKMDTNPPETIQGRQYRVVNRNAFLSSAEKSLGVAAVFAPLLGIDLPAPEPAKGKEVRYAVCLYDPNTLIVAEHNLMQRYLTDLKDGYPEFVTQYKEFAPPPPPADADGQGGGTPSSGGRQQGGRGGEGERQQGGGGESGRGGVPGQPRDSTAGGGSGPFTGGAGGGGGGPAAPPKPKKPITSNPTFRTVEVSLKRAMNALQDEEKDMPVAAYATKVNAASVNLLDPKSLLNPQAVASFALLQDVRLLGMAVTRLTDKRGSFSGYIEYRDADSAKSSVDQKLIPGLTLIASRLPEKLQPIAVRDMDDPANAPSGGTGGYGQPGGYGYGGQGSGGGGLSPLPPPGSPGGGISPLPPPGSPGGGPRPSGGGGREAGAPLGSGGASGDENAQGPRGSGQQPRPGGGGGGLSPLPPPGGPGGGQGEGGYGYGGQGGEGTGPGGPTGPTDNTINVSRDGSVVTLAIEFNWKEDVFATAVEPVFARQGALLRGKMGMFSGEGGVFALAARTTDGKTAGGLPAEAVGKQGQLPQGALPRDARTDDRRLPGSNQGLPYQPEQRCSFFAELIRYMDNKASLHRRVDTNQAWYQGANLSVAEAWVPELLVSDYPQSAWRATSDLIPDGRSVGATNYVGVAGLGLDAARLNPKNPDDAKKMGLTGYDWGSKPEEVTDGLSNTMYLIQVPPTYQRPWMAGGGATVMGVNDKGSDPARPFMHKKADGSRGTMVLMADGSVRYVKEGIDPAVFRGMATRAGGEKITDLDKVAPPVTNGMPGELKATK